MIDYYCVFLEALEEVPTFILLPPVKKNNKINLLTFIYLKFLNDDGYFCKQPNFRRNFVFSLTSSLLYMHWYRSATFCNEKANFQ